MRPFVHVIINITRRNFEYNKRNFLSSAFECNEAWNSRLNAPVFQKVNIEGLYYELASQYNKTKKLNPVDVDLFVTSQRDNLFLTEAEEIIHKLRLSPDTHRTLPTTHHAIVRLFINSERRADLLRILNDRLNYGIFPDNYCIIYMLDKLLKDQDFRNAAKVASLQMIQEDFSHHLIRYLSLYAVHKYILSNTPWEDAIKENETKTEDDEEVVLVKVPVLRNPYFDDHFDLVNGNHICGKTLAMVGSHLNSSIGNSYKIMGLALHNKWDKLIKEMTCLTSAQNKPLVPVLYSESLDFVSKIINSELQENEKLDKLMNLINQVDIEYCIKSSLLAAVEEKIQETVNVCEKNDMKFQEQLYKDWEVLRDIRVKEYFNELDKQKRLQEVKQKTEELKLKEELLYFFDKEDEIDLVIEEKEEMIRKRTFPETEKEKEEDYIPPEVQKRLTDF